MRPARLGVVLVAHGSRDPRAAASTSALVRAVAAAHPEWDVRAAYLDHAGPRPLDVLTWLSAVGHRHAVVVPLLLTAAYHGRVDVPAIVDQARDAGLGIQISITEVLGPSSDLLLDGLIRRLSGGSSSGASLSGGSSSAGSSSAGSLSVGSLSVGSLDAVVLAAAGTRDAAARETVAAAAAELGARLGVPWAVAYSSAAPPLAGDAVRSLGAARVGVAAYFLAPGRLYDIAVDSALAAGAVVVAPPLGDAPELVALITSRVHTTVMRRLVAA